MEKGCELEVIITGINHQGKGVARIDNKVIFVSNTLIGEVVNICITKVNKKFLEAEVINYISKCDNRVIPECPYYSDCGGCDIMHMSYKCQHNFKVNKVKEIINKFVKEDIIINDIVYGSQFNYRNKTTFHVKEKIGFYKEKTYELINIDRCLISSKEINSVLNILSNMDLININSIVIRSSYDNGNIMVVLNIMDNIDENMFINKLKNSVNSLYIKKDDYRLIYGDKYIVDKIGDLSFVISPDSFFQVNTDMAYKLYSKVLEYSLVDNNKKVLDLYCGTGTIGLFLASNCKELVGVEINQSAINDANVNKETNGFNNVKFICGDSGKVLRKLSYKPDIVIVDPPRSGLDNLAINQVIDVSASRVVYVSCDPVTLARDLNILKEYYDIIEISLVDMFPNTHHVESVVLLVKDNKKCQKSNK